MDETTHAFSPKVLDRAFTIEFEAADLESYPVSQGDALRHWPMINELRC